MNFLIKATIWLAMLFPLQQLFAQQLIQDEDALPVLLFENLEKNRKHMISQGGTIKYKLNEGNGKWIKGTLEAVNDYSMVVNGEKVAFKDCAIIAGKVCNDKKLYGGLALGTGFSAAIIGGALITTLPVIGPAIAIVGVGAVGITTGIILITNHKKFNLNKGWQVYGAKINFKRA